MVKMKYTISYNRIIVCIGILLAIIIWSLYQCKNPNIVMDHVKEYFNLDEDILSSDIPIKLEYNNNNNYISVTFNYKNHPIVKTVTYKNKATNFYVDYMGKDKDFYNANTYCMYIKQENTQDDTQDDTQEEKNYTKKYITYNSNNEGERKNNDIYFEDIGGGNNQRIAFEWHGTTYKICFSNKNKNIMFLDYNSNTNTLKLVKNKSNSNLIVDFEPPSTEYTQKAIVYRDDFPNTEHNTEHNTPTEIDYITGSGYGDITDNNKLIPYFKNVWKTQGDTKWYSNDKSLSISFTEFDDDNKTCTIEFSNELENKVINNKGLNYTGTLEKQTAKIISSNLIMFGSSGTSTYKIFFKIVPTPEKYDKREEPNDKILHPLYYLQVWAIKNEDPLTRINLFYRKKYIGNDPELEEDKNGYFIKVHEKDIGNVRNDLPESKPEPEPQLHGFLGSLTQAARSLIKK